MTELLVAASGWGHDRLEASIPPACRARIEPAPPPVIAGEEVLVELPDLVPRAGARHLLPSFSVLGDQAHSYRFEMSVRAAGPGGNGWSPWVGAASLGPAAFAPVVSEADGLAADVDVFLAARPVERVRLRLRVRALNPGWLLAAPWFIALSACDPGAGAAAQPAAGAGDVWLPVPVESQMERSEAIRLRICSPTSVAMVLGYWGRPVDVDGLAAEMLHPALDRYGVWPAAIRAAGRRGVAGYLLRFPDWPAAAWCLDHGLPVIASVRYGPGELQGAAIPETTGHLLVLTGYTNDEVRVNDPAAATAGEVARRYPREELCRAWLEQTGVGYVLFRPD